MSSFTGVHTTVDPRGFEVVTMVRRVAGKELITDEINKLQSQASHRS